MTTETTTNRATYEAACAVAGIESWGDAYILRAAYTLQYPDGQALSAAQVLARTRLAGLDNERIARQAARPVAPVTMATCARCGDEMARSMLLSSSHGAVCPDCYD